MRPEPELCRAIIDGSVYQRDIYCHCERTVQVLISMDWLTLLSAHLTAAETPRRNRFV